MITLHRTRHTHRPKREEREKKTAGNEIAEAGSNSARNHGALAGAVDPKEGSGIRYLRDSLFPGGETIRGRNEQAVRKTPQSRAEKEKCPASGQVF